MHVCSAAIAAAVRAGPAASAGAAGRSHIESPPMPTLVLGPLLRYAGDTEATVWVETGGRCEVDVLGRTAATFEVRGHHYALVALTGLEPAATLEYSVKLDGETVWPPAGDGRPASAIHTRAGERRARLVFGSCRVGAPEREPYSLPRGEHPDGLGVDALWAYSRRLQAGLEPWPDGLLLIGDQVYADEVSPETLAFIRARRDTSTPPGEEVADFEEYTRLYRESWSDPDIRWLLSTVPSVMIFDDHDVIDDWNISREWLRDARAQPWWHARITGAFMSYWIYQHLGNLPPPELAGDPTYRTVVEKDGDAGPELEEFAVRVDHEYAATRWACLRDFGRTRVLVVDSRAARVLERDRRRLVDDEEWAWIVDRSREEVDHLLIVSTLPVFMPPAIHHLEAWNEAVCDGAWGGRAARLGERVRRALDLEHWPAFQTSFARMVDLLRDVATGGEGSRRPPASVSVIGGDIHNAYVADVSLGRRDPSRSRVHQIVCSPFRNPLPPAERRLFRLARTRPATACVRAVAGLAGVRPPAVRWRMRTGPTFENSVGIIEIDGRRAAVTILRAEQGAAEDALQPLHAHELAPG
jgi:PhoD-like phosphatase